MKKISFLILLALGSSVIIGNAQNPRKDQIEEPRSVKSDLVQETYSLIKQRYPDHVDDERLLSGAADGMLKSLDVFGEYLSRREFQEMQNEVKGEYGGVGLVIAGRGDFPTIVRVLSRSPSEQAGISEGDEVINVDGEDLFHKPINYAIERLRGPIGSQVAITVKKKETREVLGLRLERAKIKIESIRESRVIPAHIGYIKLVEYVENTHEDLGRALKQLKDSNIEMLILDLRNNMGGTLESAVEVCQKFLPKGKLIVSTSGRLSKDQTSYYSNGESGEVSLPLVVLVNRISASASEVVASALQDNGRARIVGEKTFGKGSVQTVFPLSEGSAIRLTTAHYVTPKGHIIDKKGIKPDIALVFPDEDELVKEVSEKRDSILEKTVEMINAKKI